MQGQGERTQQGFMMKFMYSLYQRWNSRFKPKSHLVRVVTIYAKLFSNNLFESKGFHTQKSSW